MSSTYQNNSQIAILLGAYNGSDFINEQITSILNQTYKDWTLYIRDDASTDNTMSIIERFESQNSNIIIVKDKMGNLGCKNNFFQLLDLIDSPYYMFCDHDDVWLPNKIEVSMARMREIEMSNPSLPVIVYTDLTVVDRSLNTIHKSFWNASKIVPEKLNSFESLSVYNLATGCTMLFNSSAKKSTYPFLQSATMHDSFLTLRVCAAGGILSGIALPTILYRQHGKNVVGAENYHQSYLWKKMNNWKRVWQTNAAQYKMVNEIKKIGLFHYLFYKFIYILGRR